MDELSIGLQQMKFAKGDPTPAYAHMKLRKEPARPSWKPIYADLMNRVKSWPKIIGEAHWTVSIEC